MISNPKKLFYISIFIVSRVLEAKKCHFSKILNSEKCFFGAYAKNGFIGLVAAMIHSL